MGETCRTHWGKIIGYKMLVGKPQDKRPLGRHRRTWEYNIKMDLRETGCEHVFCGKMVQKRIQGQAFVNRELESWAPQRQENAWLRKCQVFEDDSCTEVSQSVSQSVSQHMKHKEVWNATKYKSEARTGQKISWIPRGIWGFNGD
jgi:leucyl-tRNA synthetase